MTGVPLWFYLCDMGTWWFYLYNTDTIVVLLMGQRYHGGPPYATGVNGGSTCATGIPWWFFLCDRGTFFEF